jgi:hypothetical protein
MTRTTSRHMPETVELPAARAPQLWDFLLNGPDPVEHEEPLGLLEVLLPWPVRVLLVLAASALAWSFADSGLGQQLSWGAQAGALALMGIVAGLWWQVLAADTVLALLWFLPFRAPQGAGRYWNLLHVITFANRQVGHLWALLVWLVLALAASAGLPVQVGGAVALLLLGPPLLNWLARRRFRVLELDGRSKTHGDLLWRRRIIIYGVTCVGWVWLAAGAPRQFWRLAPLIVAWGVGWALRVARHLWRNRKVSLEVEEEGERGPAQAARASFREGQAAAARQADGGGALLLPLALVAIVVFSFSQRRALDRSGRERRAEPAYASDACGRGSHPPLVADVGIFLLADAQVHERSGAPFPGQAEIAQVFVSSASRPVELDMLGPLSLRHFARVYAELNAQRVAAGQSRLGWAHLGDMADISCERELGRVRSELGAFGSRGPLAGIAVGNHEMSFEGSFHWSPHWDPACASGKLDKDATSQALSADFGPALARAGGELVRLSSPFGSPRGGSLSAVSPLGVARQGARQRGVLGVFLDSNDGRAFDWGMPGSVGSVSAEQLADVRSALTRVASAAGAAYSADPAYIIFSHIPYRDLASASRGRVADWLSELDGLGADLAAEPRVLAFISAHTHEASTERHCVGNRLLRQITVGSTTDPPQQAAVALVGADAEGRLALAVHALQAIERSPQLACGAEPRISAGVCQRVAHELNRAPACRAALGAGSDTETPRDCQDIEHSSSLSERFASLQSYAGPRSPDARRARDQRLARQLLACVCRGDVCKVPESPLDEDAYRLELDRAWEHPERRDELACLAWAAAATQAHKASEMSLGEALRCSFDDPSLPPERIYTAALEPAPCY